MSDSAQAGYPRTSANIPEPRDKRRTSVTYVVFSVFVTLLGAAVLFGLAVVYGSRQLEVAGPLSEEKTVAIERGASTSAIARRLSQSGVIANERVFFLAAAVRGRMGDSLKAGEYRFAPGDSMAKVLEKITSGKALVYKVTIPEGLTSEQVLQRLNDTDALAGDLPVTVAEGVLLPDTYVFNRNMTRADLLQKMRQAQNKLLDRLWQERAVGLPIRTKEEALILASIVEKETGVAAERARVAAVFHNRLIRGMRLQSDPTIIYGIAGGKGRLDRPILRSDIDGRTPYNTYQIDGLPPTPIANPGREAIAAVLRPASTDELYFVADGNGGHVFARTLEQHNANVRNWRKIEQQRRLAATNPDETPEPVPEAAQASQAAQVPQASQASQADEPAAAPEPQAASAASPATDTATETASVDPAPVSPTDELPVAGSEPATPAEPAAAPSQKVPLPRRKPALN